MVGEGGREKRKDVFQWDKGKKRGRQTWTGRNNRGKKEEKTWRQYYSISLAKRLQGDAVRISSVSLPSRWQTSGRRKRRRESGALTGLRTPLESIRALRISKHQNLYQIIWTVVGVKKKKKILNFDTSTKKSWTKNLLGISRNKERKELKIRTHEALTELKTLHPELWKLESKHFKHQIIRKENKKQESKNK